MRKATDGLVTEGWFEADENTLTFHETTSAIQLTNPNITFRLDDETQPVELDVDDFVVLKHVADFVAGGEAMLSLIGLVTVIYLGFRLVTGWRSIVERARAWFSTGDARAPGWMQSPDFRAVRRRVVVDLVLYTTGSISLLLVMGTVVTCVYRLMIAFGNHADPSAVVSILTGLAVTAGVAAAILHSIFENEYGHGQRWLDQLRTGRYGSAGTKAEREEDT